MIDRAALPSADYQSLIAQDVLRKLSRVSPELIGVTMDVLGDVCLSLACRTLTDWYGDRDQLARLAGPGWAWPEATAAIELATEGGLLVPWRDGALRPVDLASVIWLAARRTALSQDERELMSHRHRGTLFDVFALAPAFTDEEEGAGLVEMYATHEGPWEDLLQLGSALAASAVAWGAPVGAERRAELVRAAFDWTGIDGSAHLREAGAALLAAEVRGGPFDADVREGAAERLDAVLERLAEPGLADHPALLATLEADLIVAAAASGGEFGVLADLIPRLGARHASALGRAIGKAFVPGEAKNRLLGEAAQAALSAGDDDALSALGALVEPFAAAVGPVHDAFKAALDGEERYVEVARGACRAIARWRSAPELTSHLLARLVVAPVDPELRLDAAAALSKHPARFAPARARVLETLEEGFGDTDPLKRTANVGAAMLLGTGHHHAPAVAVGLIADGVPADVLGPPLAEGLREAPEIAAGLIEVWDKWGTEAAIQQASVDALEQVGLLAQREHNAGVFFLRAEQTGGVKAALTKYLLGLAGDLSRPELAGTAALAASWISRGDVALAKTFMSLRQHVEDEEHQALLAMALGAGGVPHELVVTQLARDVAESGPSLAAAAAMGLISLLDERGDADPIDPFIDVIRARVDLEGPQQAPIYGLLHLLAVLPLGEEEAAPTP